MMIPASSKSASVGSSVSCGARPSNRPIANRSTIVAAATEPRRKRDASAFVSNCHQRLLEYSTCLNANTPSHAEADTAATTAAIHDAENRVAKNDALRSKAGLDR